MKLSNIFIFLILFSLTLNEFYHLAYGRVFDYFAILVIIVSLILQNKSEILKIKKSDSILLLITLPFLIIGIIKGKFLTSFAILIGFSLIFFYSKHLIKYNLASFIKIINLIIIVHLVFFVIQALCYYLLHLPFSYVDFFPFFIKSRVYNEALHFFRTSGLMMEPNAYSANMLMLAFIKYKLKDKIDNILRFTIFSIFLSFSLWGILMSIILFILYSKPKLVFYLISTLIIFSSFILKSTSNSITLQRITTIIEDPFSDNSIDGRLGLSSRKQLNIFELLFGHGPNSESFQEFAGANGFSFMVFSFGLIWTFIFLWLIFKTNTFKIFILFLFFNLTFPYFSYLIYYVFLAVLFYSQIKDNDINYNPCL